MRELAAVDVIEEAVVETGMGRDDEIALTATEGKTQTEHRRRACLALIETHGGIRSGVVKKDDAKDGEAVKRQSAQPADAHRASRVTSAR